MFPSLVLPIAVALALGVLVATSHRLLPPVLAARAITVTVVVVVGAALPTLWIISLGYMTHIPLLGAGLEWCAKAFGVHDPIPAWVGLPAMTLGIAGLVRARSVLRSYRRLRHDSPAPVEIADHDRPVAFTLPGRGGHVVVSSALVELLDEDEQRVVLAHEHAHARHRHDCYILTAALATAVLPLLHPLSSRLQFSLERWADEAAVDECGDRRFVARTLGKVALNSVTPVGAMSFAGLGVPARVAALLAPPMGMPGSSALLALWGAIGVTGVFAVFQLHHLASIVTALCPG